jgi:simple sugar transport system substrate-binding protein
VTRLLVLALLALVAAGCGKVTEQREPDLFAGQGIKPAPVTRSSGDRSIRISVVTHGTASSAFWNVVRNGVDAAARQMDVSTAYTSPDTFSVPRMRQLIDAAVDSNPDALVVSIPSAELGPSIRRAVRAEIPVVSINSGSDVFRDLGVLAHVGQLEESAGKAAGERMAARGARRGLCLIHEPGNRGLEQRCRSFGQAIRRGGGAVRTVDVDLQDLGGLRETLRAEIVAQRADAVLALSSNAAIPAVDAVAEAGRQADTGVATFDLSPEILDAVKDRKIDFAIDQQAYLQGYLPIVMLTQYARYGLLPSQGEVVATGPNFVTPENAEQAIQLSARGIR